MAEDINTLNKYRLNYHCFSLKMNREQAKKDYIDFARSVYPNQAKGIELFEREYNVNLPSAKRVEQTLKWMVKDNFYWHSIKELPRSSYVPEELAYLRLLFQDIEEAIYKGYKKQKQSRITKATMVLQLT